MAGRRTAFNLKSTVPLQFVIKQLFLQGHELPHKQTRPQDLIKLFRGDLNLGKKLQQFNPGAI